MVDDLTLLTDRRMQHNMFAAALSNCEYHSRYYSLTAISPESAKDSAFCTHPLPYRVVQKQEGNGPIDVGRHGSLQKASEVTSGLGFETGKLDYTLAFLCILPLRTILVAS